MIRFDLDDRTYLRGLQLGDEQVVLETVLANYDRLRKHMHWMTPDFSIEDARSFVFRNIDAVHAGKAFSLAIMRDERFAGSIGYVYIDTIARKTEIGYWIDGREEGKGIISMSCRRLINYAFGDLGMNRIEIRCSVENLRSAAVPERLGFTREGVLRQAEKRDGRLHDFAMYGLLRSEWNGA